MRGSALQAHKRLYFVYISSFNTRVLMNTYINVINPSFFSLLIESWSTLLILSIDCCEIQSRDGVLPLKVLYLLRNLNGFTLNTNYIFCSG